MVAVRGHLRRRRRAGAAGSPGPARLSFARLRAGTPGPLPDARGGGRARVHASAGGTRSPRLAARPSIGGPEKVARSGSSCWPSHRRRRADADDDGPRPRRPPALLRAGRRGDGARAADFRGCWASGPGGRRLRGRRCGPCTPACGSLRPSAHCDDNRRLVFELDSAAFTAPVFVDEDDDVFAGVDEVLSLEAALLPCFGIVLELSVDPDWPRAPRPPGSRRRWRTTSTFGSTNFAHLSVTGQERRPGPGERSLRSLLTSPASIRQIRPAGARARSRRSPRRGRRSPRSGRRRARVPVRHRLPRTAWTEKVEKVVKPPRKPTPRPSRTSRPNQLLAVSSPRAKQPEMLIAAVIQISDSWCRVAR